jgi:hypothetical protein
LEHLDGAVAQAGADRVRENEQMFFAGRIASEAGDVYTGMDEHDRSDHRSPLTRVLEANERRLEALDRQGVRVTVDGAALLRFFLDRAATIGTQREFRTNWVMNVAGLLDELDDDGFLDADRARTDERHAIR